MNRPGGHIIDAQGAIHNPDRMAYVWIQRELETYEGLSEDEESIIEEFLWPGWYMRDIDENIYELTEEGYEAALSQFQVRSEW